MVNKLRKDWKMPKSPNKSCSCGLPMNKPIAIDEGEWILAWECDNYCGEGEIMNIDVWPFEDEYATDIDMVHAGFDVI